MFREQKVFKLKDKYLYEPIEKSSQNYDQWEQVFIKPNKYSGSLRYTLIQQEAEDDKYSLQFKGLSYIELNQNKIDQFYYAQLISVQYPKERKKNSCKKSTFSSSQREKQDDKRAESLQKQTKFGDSESTNSTENKTIEIKTEQFSLKKRILNQNEQEKECEHEVIAIIRCDDKMALQYYQNALEEAQSDLKEVGRPLTLIVHDGHYVSLLSEYDSKQDEKQGVQLRGILNLLVTLLVTTNLYNILISLENHGLTITQIYQEVVDKGYLIKMENYQTIAGLFTLPIFTQISFWIEILATKRVPDFIIISLIILNLSALLTFPIIFSFYIGSNQGIGAYFLLYSCCTTLKLISFHHTFNDVRSLVKRVIKAKREGKILEPSKTEGTIFGVSKPVFDQALTYPRCLSHKNFLRFLLAPTCCYQLEYPLIDKIRWYKILEHFTEFILSNLMMLYIFMQHVAPKCNESLIHFEQQNYLKIFTAVLGTGVPCTYIWLSIFYGLFHAWTNFWGEVTRFADRRFYSDWWNAGDLAEYWRKWNYPIHNWLVRHCYYPLIRRGLPSEIAQLLTFLVSAIFHEYIIIGIFRVCNLFAFTLMAANVPLIQIQKKLTKTLLTKNHNNIFFWIVFTILGLPFGFLIFYYYNMRHTLFEIGGPLYINKN